MLVSFVTNIEFTQSSNCEDPICTCPSSVSFQYLADLYLPMALGLDCKIELDVVDIYRCRLTNSFSEVKSNLIQVLHCFGRW